MSASTFAARYNAGEFPDQDAAHQAAMDEFRRWFESDTDMPIHEWFGMTPAEYQAWLKGKKFS